jgi:hypothetical protein
MLGRLRHVINALVSALPVLSEYFGPSLTESTAAEASTQNPYDCRLDFPRWW